MISKYWRSVYGLLIPKLTCGLDYLLQVAILQYTLYILCSSQSLSPCFGQLSIASPCDHYVQSWSVSYTSTTQLADLSGTVMTPPRYWTPHVAAGPFFRLTLTWVSAWMTSVTLHRQINHLYSAFTASIDWWCVGIVCLFTAIGSTKKTHVVARSDITQLIIAIQSVSVKEIFFESCDIRSSKFWRHHHRVILKGSLSLDTHCASQFAYCYWQQLVVYSRSVSNEKRSAWSTCPHCERYVG